VRARLLSHETALLVNKSRRPGEYSLRIAGELNARNILNLNNKRQLKPSANVKSPRIADNCRLTIDHLTTALAYDHLTTDHLTIGMTTRRDP
jgi:hypothetical protein